MPSCGVPWLNSCAPRYNTRRFPEPSTCAISVSVSPLNKYGGPLRCVPPSVISSAPNCAGAPALPGADAGCGGECLLVIDPLEAKPTSYDASIQTEHPFQSPQALQEARQFSAEGTAMSIDRAFALRDYPVFPRPCYLLRQTGQSGPIWLTSA